MPGSSYAEVRCNYNSNLEFVSFYTPLSQTLTITLPPKYEVVVTTSYVILIIYDIVESDKGLYQCNFEDNNGDQCFKSKRLVFTENVEFCTPNAITYHAYVGSSVTLECCVNNYEAQAWSMNDEMISDSDVFAYDGTHLQINPVSLEHRGEYECIAVHENNQHMQIRAYLKVYSELIYSVILHNVFF